MATILFGCNQPVVPDTAPAAKDGQSIRRPGLVELADFRVIECTWPGILMQVKVRDGDTVQKDDILAEFSNTEAESRLRKAQREKTDAADRYELLEKQWTRTTRAEQKIKLEDAMRKAKKDGEAAWTDVQKWTEVREMLALKAPWSGIASGLPSIEDVGKGFEKGAPFCRVSDPTKLCVTVPVSRIEFDLIRGEFDQRAKEGQKLAASFRVGQDGPTGQGRIIRLPEKEAESVPLALSTRGGGPITVKGGARSKSLVPQTPQFLIEIEVDSVDRGILAGSRVDVEIRCRGQE